MTPAVNLIVTCTRRKTLATPPHRRMSDVNARDITRRFQEWVKRLTEGNDDTLPAHALYAGDHWSITRNLVQSADAGARPVNGWICSAGYGLIGMDTAVRSYAATFSHDNRDSVTKKLPGRTAAVEWWEQLCHWRGPEPGRLRRLAEVARHRPDAVMLVVGSPAYIGAVSDDLVAARAELADPERLIIISAGLTNLPPLDEHLLPCDARMQKSLGGALMSLNIRMAREVLTHNPKGDLRIGRLRTRYKALLARQPDLVSFDRAPLDDDQVRDFIRKALKVDRTLRHTPLLRSLRAIGRACEQKRFRALWYEVRRELDARGSARI